MAVRSVGRELFASKSLGRAQMATHKRYLFIASKILSTLRLNKRSVS